MNTGKLTLKQRKFIKHYLAMGNACKAALAAGYKNKISGPENLSKLINNGLFEQFLTENGLDDKAIFECLIDGLQATKPISCNVYIKKDGSEEELKDADGLTKDFIEVEDYATRHKYLETLLKLYQKIRRPVEEEQEKQGDLTINLINMIENVNTNKEFGGLDRLKGSINKDEILDRFVAK